MFKKMVLNVSLRLKVREFNHRGMAGKPFFSMVLYCNLSVVIN